MKTEMYTMINYIKKFHQHTDPWFKKEHPDGSKAAFALEFGRKSQAVTTMYRDAAQWGVVIHGDIKYLVQIRVAVPL